MVPVGILCERVVGEPIGMSDPPLFAIIAVVAYGMLANVCYTGGWLAELLVRKLWGAQAESFGEISFALGVAFSVLLTLVPAAVRWWPRRSPSRCTRWDCAVRPHCDDAPLNDPPAG